MSRTTLTAVTCPLCGPLQAPTRRIRSYIGGFPINVATCPQCGLAFQSPQPTQQEGTEYFNWRYQTGEEGKTQPDQALWDRDFILSITRARAAWILEQLGGGADGRRLLDIGTGNGALVFAAREAGFDAAGIDLSEEAVTTAKRLFDIDVRLAAAEDLPPNETYDVITTFATIEHMRDPAATLAAAFKHLAPGGRFFLETMNYHSLPRLLHGDDWYFFLFDHLFYFTPSTLRTLLERTGYEQVQVHNAPPAADMTRKENYRKDSPGPFMKLATRITHVLSHPCRTLRYPWVRRRARRLWPDRWRSEVLLMSAAKPRS